MIFHWKLELELVAYDEHFIMETERHRQVVHGGTPGTAISSGGTPDTGYGTPFRLNLTTVTKSVSNPNPISVNSRGLRVFVLSFVRPPTRETTVFNISFMRLFVTEAS